MDYDPAPIRDKYNFRETWVNSRVLLGYLCADFEILVLY